MAVEPAEDPRSAGVFGRLTGRPPSSILPRGSQSDQGGNVFARIASFEGGDAQRLKEMSDQQMADGTAGLPDGLRRAMVLQDRVNDRRLFVTFFDSREAVTAAEQRFEEMGDEVPEEVRGRRTGVDVYEVVWEADV
jgi:hypothetical protein